MIDDALYCSYLLELQMFIVLFQAIAVGLNVVREICLRMPLVIFITCYLLCSIQMLISGLCALPFLQFSFFIFLEETTYII